MDNPKKICQGTKKIVQQHVQFVEPSAITKAGLVSIQTRV